MIDDSLFWWNDKRTMYEKRFSSWDIEITMKKWDRNVAFSFKEADRPKERSEFLKASVSRIKEEIEEPGWVSEVWIGLLIEALGFLLGRSVSCDPVAVATKLSDQKNIEPGPKDLDQIIDCLVIPDSHEWSAFSLDYKTFQTVCIYCGLRFKPIS